MILYVINPLILYFNYKCYMFFFLFLQFLLKSTSDEENAQLSPYFYGQDILSGYDEINKRKNNNDEYDGIDKYFNQSKKLKKTNTSSIMRPTKEGFSYLTNESSNGTHIIKIEVIKMENIEGVLPNEQWKHADIRTKYIIEDANDNILLDIKNVLFKMTKNLSEQPQSKKFIIRR